MLRHNFHIKKYLDLIFQLESMTYVHYLWTFVVILCMNTFYDKIMNVSVWNILFFMLC